MGNLINIQNGQAVTTSRQLAENFGKLHKDVLENVREVLAAENSATKLFFASTYENRGKQYPEYLMNRDGFTLLAMGFTGSDAMQWKLKYIQAFNEMEKQLTAPKIPKSLPEALRLAADLAEKNETLQLQTAQQTQIINELKPKADYTDLILKSKGLVTITQISKDYGMSGQAMNKLLHELKVQYNQGGQWLLYAIIQDRGYTHSETISFKHSDGRPGVSMVTKWTQKGRLYLYELLKSNNVLPTIEI